MALVAGVGGSGAHTATRHDTSHDDDGFSSADMKTANLFYFHFILFFISLCSLLLLVSSPHPVSGWFSVFVFDLFIFIGHVATPFVLPRHDWKQGKKTFKKNTHRSINRTRTGHERIDSENRPNNNTLYRSNHYSCFSHSHRARWVLAGSFVSPFRIVCVIFIFYFCSIRTEFRLCFTLIANIDSKMNDSESLSYNRPQTYTHTFACVRVILIVYSI